MLLTQVSTEHTIAYMFIYITFACMVYIVMIKRAEEELGRKTIDAIFFTMIGAASIIWILSKVPPIS